MRLPIFISPKKRKMRDSLFGYMMILTIVIVIVIGFGMLIMGTFTKSQDIIENTLGLQIEVFEKEIMAHNEKLAIYSLSLSDSSAQILDSYLKINNLNFKDINGSAEHISGLQSEFLSFAESELVKTDNSGIFIVLDATVNTDTDNSEYSKTGLYLQKSSGNISNNSLLLFRGDSSAGKEKGIMPHRKWQLEFDSRVFKAFDKNLSSDITVPLEKAYSFTDVKEIPGTSEKASLITIPIRLDGENVGVCGYEVSHSNFKTQHAQGSTLERLMCIWMPYKGIIDPSNALICGTREGYYLPPSETLYVIKDTDGLAEFSGEYSSYVGMYRPLADGSAIAVMIPKSDYDKAISTSTVQIIAFLVLLSAFAISLCKALSNRFIAPIIKGLEQIRSFEHQDSVSNLHEMNDLFDFLAEKDKELEFAYEMLSMEKEQAENELSRVQHEIDKLSYSRKNEINPDDYENFVLGIKTLTKTERKIFEMYLDGKTAKEIIEITGTKESTLKFHNSNIYEKLGVSSRKQMLIYAALYTRETSGGKL